MEQSGPNCIIVDRDRMAVEIEFELATEHIIVWSEEGPGHHPDEVFGALTILEEEEPTGADPVDAIAQWSRSQTEEFRQDWTSRWEPVKAALARDGIDPERCILVEHLMGSGGDRTVVLAPERGLFWLSPGSGLESVDESTLVTERRINENRIAGSKRLLEHESTGSTTSGQLPGPDRRAVVDRVRDAFQTFGLTVTDAIPDVQIRPEADRRGDAVQVVMWFRLPTTPSSRKGEVWIDFSWGRAKGFYRLGDGTSVWPDRLFNEESGDGLDLVIRASNPLGGRELDASPPMLLPADPSSSEYAVAVERFVDEIPRYLGANRGLILDELRRRVVGG